MAEDFPKEIPENSSRDFWEKKTQRIAEKTFKKISCTIPEETSSRNHGEINEEVSKSLSKGFPYELCRRLPNRHGY